MTEHAAEFLGCGLSLELPTVNEPAAPDNNKRSYIRMNHEFPIGAWATLLRCNDRPDIAEVTQHRLTSGNNLPTDCPRASLDAASQRHPERALPSKEAE